MKVEQKLSTDVCEHADLIRKTGDCYRLMAACFYLPDKALLIEEHLFHSLEKLLNEVCPAAAPFAAAMRDALDQNSEEELALEYAQLFVGPFELQAPPYGSVYLDRDRKVMGDSTIEVLNFYRTAGLSISDEFAELPDHITAELEFMYFLTFRGLELLDKSETSSAAEFFRMQRVFLSSFPGKWAHLFSDRITAGSENAFYIALAECLSIFIGEALRKNLHPDLQEV